MSYYSPYNFSRTSINRAAAPLNPDFEADFSSNPFTINGTAFSFASNVLSYVLDGQGGNGDSNAFIDLQTALGEAVGDDWVIRYDLNNTLVTRDSTVRLTNFFGIADINADTITDDGTTDLLGISADIDSNSAPRNAYGTAASLVGGTNPITYMGDTIVDNDHWYIEIVRDDTATDLIVKFFPNSSFASPTHSVTQDISSIDAQGLRYFMLLNDATGGGGTNSQDGNISQFAMWNNATVVS